MYWEALDVPLVKKCGMPGAELKDWLLVEFAQPVGNDMSKSRSH